MRRISTLSLSVALALGSVLMFSAPLAAQAALFAPGATLDPGCPPTDIANCGIATTTQVTVSTLAATTTLPGIVTLPNLTTVSTSLTGFLKATAGVLSTALINLASDVTGILPVSNGGTGVSAIKSGFIPFGNGTGAVATSSALYFDTSTNALNTVNANILSLSSIQPNITVVFDGDSITYGNGLNSGESWPEVLQTLSAFTGKGQFINDASSGSTVANVVSRYSVHVQPYKPVAGSRSILMVMVGTNDIGRDNSTGQSTFDALNSYLQTAKADGFEIWLFTIIDRVGLTPQKQHEYQVYNTLIRESTTWDKLIDLAPLFPDHTDTGLYQSDGTHPTALGARKIAELVNLTGVLGVSPVRSMNSVINADSGKFSSLAITGTTTIGSFLAGTYGSLQIQSETNAAAGSRMDLLEAAGSGAYLQYDGSTNMFNLGTESSGDTPAISIARGNSSVNFLGNVGIGKASPIATLDIVGNASSTQLTTTNSAYLATTGGNVGIGTATPAYKLSVNGLASFYSNVYVQGTAIPTSGTPTIASPIERFYASRYGAGTPISTAMSIRSNYTADNGNTMQLQFLNTTDVPIMSVLSIGNVGIGTTTPYAKLSIAQLGTDTSRTVFVISSSTSAFATTTLFSVANTGDTTITGSAATCVIGNSTGSVTCTSDARLKTNVTKIPNALAGIEQINGVTFNWSDPTKSQATYIGVIAQDVQKVFPQAVVTLDSGYLAVDYGALVAPLIEAVKELATKLETLASAFASHFPRSDTLCLDDECITKAQLHKLLEDSGQQPVAAPAAMPETPAPDATVKPAADEPAPTDDAMIEIPPETPAPAAEPVVEQSDAPVAEPAPAQ